MFRLVDIPIWCYLVSILAFLITWKIWKWDGGVLLAYVFIVFATTVIDRIPFEGSHFQPEIFWSWRMWDKQKEQILANIIVFIPIGLFAGRLWKWKGLIFVKGLSFAIEGLQLVTARGLCEFDDVMHNCIGAVIGIGLVMMTAEIKNNCKCKL